MTCHASVFEESDGLHLVLRPQVCQMNQRGLKLLCSLRENPLLFWIGPARGVLETVKKLGWRPDLIHCYGWAAALAPFYIKQAYSDEPSFRDCKVVMEVSPKEFEKDLGVENAKFVEYKDAHYADIQDICGNAYGHSELEKIGVKFADGVIIENKDVDPSVIEYAKSLGRPVLDPVEGDSFNEAYTRAQQMCQSSGYCLCQRITSDMAVW